MVPLVQEYCVEREIAVPRWRDAHEEELIAFHANVLRAIRRLGFEVAEEDRQEVAREVAKRIIGLGVLQPFLEEEGVEEIIVRDGFVQTEREGQIFDEGPLAPDEYFYRLARRIADEARGRVLRVPVVVHASADPHEPARRGRRDQRLRRGR